MARPLPYLLHDVSISMRSLLVVSSCVYKRVLDTPEEWKEARGRNFRRNIRARQPVGRILPKTFTGRICFSRPRR
jgi:hypothetical protein